MQVRAGLLAVATDIAAAVGFAVLWALSVGDCGPPSALCRFPGGGCIALCVNGWSLFPGNVLLGIILGILPALLVFGLIRRPTERVSAPRVGITVSSLLLLASVVLSSLGIDLVFLGNGTWVGVVLPWAMLGIAFVLVGVGLKWRTPSPEPPG